MKNQLYFLPVFEQIDEMKFENLLTFVSEDKRQQVKTYRFNIDKKLSLYSELIIRIIICQSLKIKNSDIYFENGVYGKPYLRNHSNFHFNISHTGDAIAAIISKSAIGIDIERIRQPEYCIAKRFFTLSEQQYLSMNDNLEELVKRFYEIWTKKEAYLKYTGYGLSMPLNAFNVLSAEIVTKTVTFLNAGYIISICNDKPEYKYNSLDEKTLERLCLEYLE